MVQVSWYIYDSTKDYLSLPFHRFVVPSPFKLGIDLLHVFPLIVSNQQWKYTGNWRGCLREGAFSESVVTSMHLSGTGCRYSEAPERGRSEQSSWGKYLYTYFGILKPNQLEKANCKASSREYFPTTQHFLCINIQYLIYCR